MLNLNSTMNHLVQAAAGAMYKGGEVQRDQEGKDQKARQMRFIFFRDQQAQAQTKANDTQGRMA